jgi:hypothetical protein
MQHEWGRNGALIGFCEKARRKETSRKTKTYVGGQYQDRPLRDIMGLMWTGLVWLRIWKSGELMWNR